MKFVVTKREYYNEYDVKLHQESKDKIKKILYFGLVLPVAGYVSYRTYNYVKESE